MFVGMETETKIMAGGGNARAPPCGVPGASSRPGRLGGGRKYVGSQFVRGDSGARRDGLHILGRQLFCLVEPVPDLALFLAAKGTECRLSAGDLDCALKRLQWSVHRALIQAILSFFNKKTC